MRFHPRVVSLCCSVVCIALTGATAFAQGRGRERPDNAPRVGDKAPGFQLELVAPSAEAQAEGSTRKSKKPTTWKLSSQRDKKPVVLAFGSFT